MASDLANYNRYLDTLLDAAEHLQTLLQQTPRWHFIRRHRLMRDWLSYAATIQWLEQDRIESARLMG